jgi:hypothetical protein
MAQANLTLTLSSSVKNVSKRRPRRIQPARQKIVYNHCIPNKIKMIKKYHIAAAVLACFMSRTNAQRDSPTVTLPSIVNRQHVLSIVPWTVGNRDLLTVVTERRITSGHETGLIRVLSIYRKEGEALVKMLDFETLDSFVTAFPLNEVGGRLFVVWTAGSAYHFSVYASVGSNVKQVLGTASRGMPEFVFDSTESDSILVTQKMLVNGEWRRTEDSTTDVYAWDGTKYELVATVPWNMRLTTAAAKRH